MQKRRRYFRFWGLPVNFSCTVKCLVFHSKSLKYGLFQENTFHYPRIIFGHNKIERQQMCDLWLSITNVLWAILRWRMHKVCIEIINSEFRWSTNCKSVPVQFLIILYDRLCQQKKKLWNVKSWSKMLFVPYVWSNCDGPRTLFWHITKAESVKLTYLQIIQLFTDISLRYLRSTTLTDTELRGR